MRTRLYFSGMASEVEAGWLREAGVRNVLVDVHDLANAKGFWNVALDSGAYRAWKRGTPFDFDLYGGTDWRGFDFVVAPDVIGGTPEENVALWKRYRTRGVVPVWHWGEPEWVLDEYLSNSTAPGGLVGIGALVPLMREKDEGMLEVLIALAEEAGQRLHLLGANWLKALNVLKGMVRSVDTSKFLDGARYGHLIFVHTKTGKLHQAPAGVLGFKGDRKARCVESAKAMRGYFEDVP